MMEGRGAWRGRRAGLGWNLRAKENQKTYSDILNCCSVDAMIFAAGLGTRLRPLTDSIPKALIEVGGMPMLERVARRLVDAGATRLIINAHHHADLVKRFV